MTPASEVRDRQLPGQGRGVVKRIIPDRGFCFVVDQEDHNEYFLHRSGCDPNSVFDNLQPGDVLVYKRHATAKGFRASDARKDGVQGLRPSEGDDQVALLGHAGVEEGGHRGKHERPRRRKNR